MSRRSPNIPTTKRRSVLFGRKLALSASFYLFALLVFPLALEAEHPLKVANGLVKEVRVARRELILLCHNPASGQTEELALKIDEHTGFSGGIHLEDLRRNDPVSADYQENDRGYARAVQVSRVPTKGASIEGLDKKVKP